LVCTPIASASQTGTVTITGEVADTNPQTAVNKQKAVDYLDQLFNQGDLTAVDRFVSDDLIQHNPQVADGPEALKAATKAILAAIPGRKNIFFHVIAEGDLVMVNSNVAQPGKLGFDAPSTFRVENGLFAEHWDSQQAVPATTASGNDMFSTLTGPATPDTPRLTAASKRVVTEYYTQLDKNHNLNAVDRFVSPSVVQHDPALANGSAAVKDAYSAQFAAFPQTTATEEMTIAEGDLVMIRYHAKDNSADLGQAVTEIFRVKNGKIIEHWGTQANVPATSANNNTMF
jgi:predicted SnoaL-like aldol condensation-catalyzing enzyme